MLAKCLSDIWPRKLGGVRTEAAILSADSADTRAPPDTLSVKIKPDRAELNCIVALSTVNIIEVIYFIGQRESIAVAGPESDEKGAVIAFPKHIEVATLGFALRPLLLAAVAGALGFACLDVACFDRGRGDKPREHGEKENGAAELHDRFVLGYV